MTTINDDKIDLRRFIAAVKRWKWIYVLTFVVLMSGSIFFALTREPKYEVWSIAIVESEQSGGGSLGAGMSQLMNMFSIGGFGSTSADNEKVVMQSHSVLEQVVKEMKLNRKYYLKEGFMRKKSFYGNSPLLVEVADEHYFDTVTKGMQFKISLKENGKADVKVVRGFFSTLYEENDMELPATIDLDNMQFTLMPTDCYDAGKSMAMNVMLSSNTAAVEALSKLLSVGDFDKKSDAVVVYYTDPNLQRGKDILNVLIAKYGEHRLKGKADKTSKGIEFIDEQLRDVYIDLSGSEVEMEKFKQENNITEVTEDIKVMLEAASKLNEGILEVKAQTLMCDLMLKFLTSEDSKYSLLPTVEMASINSSGGSKASALNSIVEQYNELVLQRMRLLRSAKPDNVALAELTKNIDAMRVAVIESVEQQRKNVDAGMSVLEGQYSEFEARLNSAPSVEREYIDIKRRLELSNQVYLMLLGKKVDYEMRQVTNVVPLTVVDEAYSRDGEASRMSSLIFPVAGLLMSLIFPTLFVVYMMYRRKEIGAEYDMPASVRRNGSKVCGDVLEMRSIILGNDTPKLVPMVYGSTVGLADGIAVLAKDMSKTYRRVLLVDLDNICEGGCDLDDIAAKQVEPSKYCGIDYLGYSGGRASDMLLNGRFGELLSSLSETYHKVIVLSRYGEDVMQALAGIDGYKDFVVYMVKTGVTKRQEVDSVVKQHHNGEIMLYMY